MMTPQASDGDAIVALAWARRPDDQSIRGERCLVLSTESTADQIRRQGPMFRTMTAKDDANTHPNPARLRRILKGEGQTLSFEATRLNLPELSPTCRYRYSVSAPVMIDDYAYIDVGAWCDSLCGSGEVLLLQRREGRWQIVESVVQYDS